MNILLSKHNGGNGIRLEGGTSNQPVNLTIESSSVNDNDNARIRQSSNYSSLLINYSNITNNVGEGVYVEGIASVTNSILWNNRYLGDLNQVSSNSGVTNIEHSSIMGLYTYGLYPIYGTSGQFYVANSLEENPMYIDTLFHLNPNSGVVDGADVSELDSIMPD